MFVCLSVRKKVERGRETENIALCSSQGKRPGRLYGACVTLDPTRLRQRAPSLGGLLDEVSLKLRGSTQFGEASEGHSCPKCFTSARWEVRRAGVLLALEVM